jgi:hypothetical protein
MLEVMVLEFIPDTSDSRVQLSVTDKSPSFLNLRHAHTPTMNFTKTANNKINIVLS